MTSRTDVLQISAGTARGTGFLLDRERVLTALHVIGRVVEDKLVLHGDDLEIRGAVLVGDAYRFRLAYGEVLAYDEQLDWACIAVDPDEFADLVALPVRDVVAADQNATWDSFGFPDSADDDGKGTGGVVESTAGTLPVRSQVIRVVQLFARGAAAGGGVHGYSGAPVVIGGHVVAILCAAHEDAAARTVDGTLYAIPIASFRDHLPAARSARAPRSDDLVFAQATIGTLRASACLVTDEAAALITEVTSWRDRILKDPVTHELIKNRIRQASPRGLFAEPKLRERLLDWISVTGFSLYVYYAQGPIDDDHLIRLPLVHRMRKKKQLIARCHARGNLAAVLDEVCRQVGSEQHRALPLPRLVRSIPLLEVTEALLEIIARHLAEPGSEDGAAEFEYLRTRTRLVMDVVTNEVHTRDHNPLP